MLLPHHAKGIRLHIFFSVFQILQSLLLIWTHFFSVYPILALAIQNVDVASADFTERVLVSVLGLDKWKFFVFWTKLPKLLLFFYFCWRIINFCWHHHFDTSPTSKALPYAHAKKIHTPSLENLDWESNHIKLFLPFFFLGINFFLKLKITTEIGKYGHHIKIRKILGNIGLAAMQVWFWRCQSITNIPM